MPRFSLSPTYDDDEDDRPTIWNKHPYRQEQSDDDDDSSYTSSSSYSSSSSEEEEPHPLGFPTRFTLLEDDDTYDNFDWYTRFGIDNKIIPSVTTPPKPRCQYYPRILESHVYVPSYTASTSALIHYAQNSMLQEEKKMEEDLIAGFDRIAKLVKAANQLEDEDVRRCDEVVMVVEEEDEDVNPLWKLVAAAEQQERNMKRRLERERLKMEQDCLRASSTLQKIIKAEEQSAKIILRREKAEKEALEAKEAARLAHIQKEQLAAKQQQDLVKQQQEEAILAKQQKIEAAEAAKEEAHRKEVEEYNKKMEYVTKAHKLCEQLKQVRATLEPFEKNKAISKRRLNMKKIVKGKLNTLSHEGNKILSVVSEIANAVEVARGEDEGVKKQLKEGGGVGMDGGGALTSDMARGKRYLVDLLASNVIVRVQAESFNGTRGDGFPLAAMLAKLSIETKDIVPILTAHLYTACPVAIPTLPTGGQGGVGESSEEDLMESLGMQKDKNGEYESFDRFLGRTEGLVSIVADIMSSYPENHSLLGGHKGAVIYLERFLAFLPPAPHQVPLLTAPVLVAFLTGAGHMLANKFPDKFRPILDTITNDVMLRLDEGTTGVPSATRLRKLTEDGFDGFKNKLPPGAIPELYDGAEGTGSGVPPAPVAPVGSSMPPMSAGEESNSFTAQTTPFGALPVTQQESQWSQNNAFGGTTNPFGQTENNSMTETAIVPSSGGANPFGSQHQQTTPFGGLTNTPSQGFNSSTPFGGGGSTAPVPFGGTSNPFDAGAGGGGGTNVQPSPFGGGGGGNNSQDNRPPCRFFAQGTCRNGANCTFSHGSTNNAQPNNAFGGGGGGNSNNGTDKKQPCRFFAQGKCRNGANCKFSHETAGGSGGATQSTGAFGASTPFGGGGNNNSQPGSFGGNTQSTPFGGGTPSTPFGGNNAGAQNNPFGGGAQNTPFGGGTQKATPFGGIGANAPTTPFGGGGSNTQTTPFGGGATNTQTTPFGGGAGNTQTTPFGGGGGINAQTTPFGGGGVTNTQTTPFGGGGGGFGSFGGGGINTTAKWAPQR